MTKEIPVKIRTQLMSAGAILALAVPVDAHAAASKSPPSHGAISATSVGKGGHLTGAKRTAPVASRVIIIKVPAQAQPIVQSQVGICQTQGAGCTDQQYCNFWNIGCSTRGSRDTTSGLPIDRAGLLSGLEKEYCCDPSAYAGGSVRIRRCSSTAPPCRRIGWSVLPTTSGRGP